MFTVSSLFKLVLRVIEKGFVFVCTPESRTFPKNAEVLVRNVLKAGVGSTFPSSFERTEKTYSLGPAGRVMVRLVPDVFCQVVSMPTTSVSKLKRLPGCSGVMLPPKVKVTVFSSTTAFSLGPEIIVVSRLTEVATSLVGTMLEGGGVERSIVPLVVISSPEKGLGIEPPEPMKVRATMTKNAIRINCIDFLYCTVFFLICHLPDFKLPYFNEHTGNCNS